MVKLSNEPLWTIDEIATAVDGVIDGEAGADITSVSIDSRTLERGALYIAIVGVAQDGHAYVNAAFDAGAGAALVKSDYKMPAPPGANSHQVLIRVDDTLAALEALGRAARARTSAKVIAITGSAGKTGTKEALKEMLRPSGCVHASVKSFNNHWGVPLSLARMPRDTEYGVFEIGMNHAGEIDPLSRMVQPDGVLITTVAPVHIGHFANEEEIADAKAEIFAGLKPGGAAILPGDNRHYAQLLARARETGVQKIYSFGKGERADFRLVDGEFLPELSRVHCTIMGEPHDFTSMITGEHIALNLLGALGLIYCTKGDVKAAILEIEALLPPKGRGDSYLLDCASGPFTLIDESYNANPASMEIALKNLAAMQGEGYHRRIAIVGDMLELGEQAPQYHGALSGLINNIDVDLVFAAGPLMKSLFDGVRDDKQGLHVQDAGGLVKTVIETVQPGDVVLVKGSQASNMALIIRSLTDKFGPNND